MSGKSFFKGLFGDIKGLKSKDLYSGPAAFSGYRPDAANAGLGTEDATRSAMGTLGEIERTGWSGADQQAQAQGQRQVARNEASQRGAVLQNAAARGQLNGGNTFLAGLATQQGAANRNMENQATLNIAGAARRQGAAMGRAQLGQQLTENDMSRAAATDQFNQWASGMQASAKQAAHDDKVRAQNFKWSRFTGGMVGG